MIDLSKEIGQLAWAQAAALASRKLYHHTQMTPDERTGYARQHFEEDTVWEDYARAAYRPG